MGARGLPMHPARPAVLLGTVRDRVVQASHSAYDGEHAKVALDLFRSDRIWAVALDDESLSKESGGEVGKILLFVEESNYTHVISVAAHLGPMTSATTASAPEIRDVAGLSTSATRAQQLPIFATSRAVISRPRVICCHVGGVVRSGYVAVLSAPC